MTKEQQLLLDLNKLLGEFIGTLEGLIANDIDPHLKLILQAKLAYLRTKEKDLDDDKKFVWVMPAERKKFIWKGEEIDVDELWNIESLKETKGD